MMLRLVHKCRRFNNTNPPGGLKLNLTWNNSVKKKTEVDASEEGQSSLRLIVVSFPFL